MKMLNQITGGLITIVKSLKPELNVSKRNIITHMINKLI